MQRIQSSNKVANLFGAGKSGFGAGNPAGGILATYLSPDWCNGLQEELLGVIENVGLAESATLTQLRQAIDMMIRRQAGAVASAAGTVNAMTADFTPDVIAYVNRMRFSVKALGANTSTTPTIAADGLAAKTIVKGSNQALVLGDIAGPNHLLQLEYDSALDKMVLLNPATGFGPIPTYQDVTGSRALGTTYTNTTGGNLWPFVSVSNATAIVATQIVVGGVAVDTRRQDQSGTDYITITAPVPPGATYKVGNGAAGDTLVAWVELRL